MIPNTPRLTYETKTKRWLATLDNIEIGTVSNIDGNKWQWQHVDGTTGTGTENQCIGALTRHAHETRTRTHQYD